MNRILEVTDEDETLVLEYVNLEDLRDERIFPRFLSERSRLSASADPRLSPH
jgi:hypothetical protein